MRPGGCRQLAWLASLLLLVFAVGAQQLLQEENVGASRGLAQANSCAAQIPQCVAGACRTATVNGALASVCQRCRTGFAATASKLNCGEQAIAQRRAQVRVTHEQWPFVRRQALRAEPPPPPPAACSHAVCPRGTYLQAGCVACGAGFWCPGGNANATNGANVDFGRRYSCSRAVVDAALSSGDVQRLGLTTRSTRAIKSSDCGAWQFKEVLLLVVVVADWRITPYQLLLLCLPAL